jgi:hypothetical protein
MSNEDDLWGKGWAESAREYHEWRKHTGPVRVTSGRPEIERRAYEAPPTAEMTVEAVKHSIRARGITALDEPATRARLSRFDEAANKEFGDWLIKFRDRRAGT